MRFRGRRSRHAVEAAVEPTAPAEAAVRVPAEDAVDPGGRLSAEAVTAVYRALLGRSPDAEGLEHWMSTSDLELVVKAVSDTDEHRRRVLLMAELAADGQGEGRGLDDVAHRLEWGDGLVALDAPVSSPAVLRTLPWHEVADPWRDLPALVLGPYGAELAQELVRRHCVQAATAGLSGVARVIEPGRTATVLCGTLLLTDEHYVRALTRVRPDVVDGTLLRVLHPVAARAGQTVEERRLAVLVARRRLHALGFIEVSQILARRHGGEPVVVDTTYAMPVAGEILTVPGEPVAESQQPLAVWLVARRVPVGDPA